MIPQPVKVSKNLNQDTSLLIFKKENRDMNGSYHCRLSLCFPVVVDEAGVRTTKGFAILAGQHVKTRVVWIFEQYAFTTIDHVINEKQEMIVEGLSTWLNKCWNKYFAQKCYYHQQPYVYQKYNLQIIRSDMIQPKPIFIYAKWDDDSQPEQIMYEYGATKRIRLEADSPLSKAEKKLDVDSQFSPELHALYCCLSGLDRFRIQEYREEPMGEYFVA